MEFTTILLFISLIFVGAFFFGYPIGLIVGSKRMKKYMEAEFAKKEAEQWNCPRVGPDPSAKIGDVLDAEILEVRNG